MPYKSKAQEAYFNANRAKMEKQGVDVGEWNAASKGEKLPKYKGEAHSYDHNRPKRPVVSRYSK
jgi:hypothetical protein